MVVFSPLSLYTTYLGWQHYDVLFDALWETGVLYIGFLMVAFRFLKNVLAPAGSTHHAAEHALNHFLFELAVIFFICAFFVYPCIPLEQKGLKFKPLCVSSKSGQVKDSSIKNTGTTYDEAFADVLTDKVKLPIGFAILQNITSSFSYGMMKTIGCSDSLQAIQGDLISTYIPEKIRKQALNFHRQCFLEARSHYLNEERTEAEDKKIEATLKRFGGEEDLNWLGSKTFKNRYYDDLKAKEPVPGFPYEQYPDERFKNAVKEDSSFEKRLPKYGFPSCNQWWEKIQKDLVQLPEKSGFFDSHLGKMDVFNRVADYKIKHKSTWHSDLTAEDYIAKVLLNDNRDLQVKTSEALIDPQNGSVGTVLSRGLVNVGQKFKSMTTTPLKRETTMQTLPVMQAFFVFFVIVFTPIVLSLSGYNPKALCTMCGLFIVSIFVQVIWHWVGFLEKSIIDPLGESDAVDAMRNAVVLFYYLAPILLLKLSNHFAGEAGSGLSSLINSAEDLSDSSAKTGETVVKTGAKIASKVIIR